jgi:repressor LexA
MPEALTPIEKKVYHYLIDFLTEHTYQPSVREIGREFRIKSTKTVSEILQSLATKGYIERDPARSRGVRLLGYENAVRVQPVPYYGRVAAGEPALLPEHRSGFITMDRRFLPDEQSFFLKIDGNSMIGRGVFDGDYVLISPKQDAVDGDMIAARLGEDATVKTLSRRNGRVVLVPANREEEELEVTSDEDFAILGKVCGVFRPFGEMERRETTRGTESEG